MTIRKTNFEVQQSNLQRFILRERNRSKSGEIAPSCHHVLLSCCHASMQKYLCITISSINPEFFVFWSVHQSEENSCLRICHLICPSLATSYDVSDGVVEQHQQCHWQGHHETEGTNEGCASLAGYVCCYCVNTVMCLDIQSAHLVLLAGQVLYTIRYKLYYLLFRQFTTTAIRRKRLSIITV